MCLHYNCFFIIHLSTKLRELQKKHILSANIIIMQNNHLYINIGKYNSIYISNM